MKVQDFKNNRIMVVDDDEFCISASKSLLNGLGIDVLHQVDFCIDGGEAVDTLIESYKNGLSYKLIFTDFKMTKMDGIEATMKMRKYLKES